MRLVRAGWTVLHTARIGLLAGPEGPLAAKKVRCGQEKNCGALTRMILGARLPLVEKKKRHYITYCGEHPGGNLKSTPALRNVNADPKGEKKDDQRFRESLQLP